ncbi:hypothetical protein COY95_04180 [Candidatus Woesearchaeota archaeon CG_4_10_14_0_8_um_filter_47_5]|nr:MAG: hypothetical protein COY95_04180 [Candidatus Woesearchaeota archaeon CG_4_10_14_0_8_um_filter_47_5]
MSDTTDENKKSSPNVISQVFALRIIKEIDPRSGKVHIEVKSRSEGLPFADAVLITEGWAKAQKQKMMEDLFGEGSTKEQGSGPANEF